MSKNVDFAVSNSAAAAIKPSVYHSPFGDLRFVCDAKTIWFVGVDIARAFGLADLRDALHLCSSKQLCRLSVWDGDRCKTVVSAHFIPLEDVVNICRNNPARDDKPFIVLEDILNSLVPQIKGLREPAAEEKTAEQASSAVGRASDELEQLRARLESEELFNDRLFAKFTELRDAVREQTKAILKLAASR